MKVKVLYFSQTREARGKGEEIFEIPTGTSLGDLKQRILKIVPSLTNLDQQIAMAVNFEIAKESARLKDGDEVALILPPSGG